jgi:N-methylhydantoinase B/oxoprolinase/acetone carboxylase alpha subunit
MMAGSVMMAFLTLGAGGLHAQVTNLVTITATAQVNGKYSYSYNNKTGVTTYSYASPTKVTFGTKQILARLAVAENAEGNYGATNFPSGAKLVVVSSYNSSGPDFQVMSSKNVLLVDVKDILTGSGSGGIYSGKTSNQYENNQDFDILSDPSTTSEEIFTLTYNDTGAFGGTGIQFYLTGLATSETTDATPNSKTLAYKETDSYTMSSSAGDGTYFGNQLVITGSLTASGSAELTAEVDR